MYANIPHQHDIDQSAGASTVCTSFCNGSWLLLLLLFVEFADLMQRLAAQASLFYITRTYCLEGSAYGLQRDQLHWKSHKFSDLTKGETIQFQFFKEPIDDREWRKCFYFLRTPDGRGSFHKDTVSQRFWSDMPCSKTMMWSSLTKTTCPIGLVDINEVCRSNVPEAFAKGEPCLKRQKAQTVQLSPTPAKTELRCARHTSHNLVPILDRYMFLAMTNGVFYK